MADKKPAKRKTRKRTTTKRPAPKKAPPIAAAPEPPRTPMLLDLTVAPERPTLRLAAGDFKIRAAEELTFAEFAAVTAGGKKMIEAAPRVDEDGVLEQLQAIIVQSAQAIICDDAGDPISDEVAGTITPGQFLRISDFFNELGRADTVPPSATGSSSVQAVSDSTEDSAAA